MEGADMGNKYLPDLLIVFPDEVRVVVLNAKYRIGIIVEEETP